MTPHRLLADNRNERSLAARMRRRRFRILEEMMAASPRPLRILDVGGTPAYWHAMGFRESPGVEVLILNLEESEHVTSPFRFESGDARDLARFSDRSFDIVFSNSVIEHVGSFEDQRRMADEVRRVGMGYCVQTPNRRFPIEPHFLFPFFQFLPVSVRVYLVRHFRLGWFDVAQDDPAAREMVTSIRLLTRGEMRALFPEGELFEERILGMVKSFVAHTPVGGSHESG